MPASPPDNRSNGALKEFIVDQAIHDLPCGFLVLDAVGRILAINDTFLRVLGYAREEVVGPMHITDLLEEPYRQSFHTHYQRFLQSGRLMNAPRIFLTKDDCAVPALLNATACKDLAGAYRHTVCVVTYTANLPLANGSHAAQMSPPTFDGAALRIRRSTPPVDILSPRERQVLSHVASGLTSQRIASLLGITVGTVEVHRRNIKSKLELRTTADLTRYAISVGLALT